MAFGIDCSTFEEAYVKSSNPDAVDTFGDIITLDGNTMAIGVPREDSNATGVNGTQTDNSASESGAVYVFARSGGRWAQQAYIKASNTDAGDEFGHSVAIDGSTLAVGAPLEASTSTTINSGQSDNSRRGTGAVYIFVRTGTTWSQQAYLKASNTQAAGFGLSVAIDNDSLVVGAPNQRSGNFNGSGAAYVFTRSGSSWSEQAELSPNGGGSRGGDHFGTVVDIDGDHVVASAPEEDSSSSGVGGDQSSNSLGDSGAVYVFRRSGTSWTQQAFIKASNPDLDDRFGEALALDGNTLAPKQARFDGSKA